MAEILVMDNGDSIGYDQGGNAYVRTGFSMQGEDEKYRVRHVKMIEALQTISDLCADEPKHTIAAEARLKIIGAVAAEGLNRD